MTKPRTYPLSERSLPALAGDRATLAALKLYKDASRIVPGAPAGVCWWSRCYTWITYSTTI